MATLHVHLQDGFAGEPVTVSIDDHVVLDTTNAMTKPQTSLAAKAKPVEVPSGVHVVSVTLPARDARIQTFAIPIQDPVTYLGLSVDESGTIRHRSSGRLFGYL